MQKSNPQAIICLRWKWEEKGSGLGSSTSLRWVFAEGLQVASSGPSLLCRSSLSCLTGDIFRDE